MLWPTLSSCLGPAVEGRAGKSDEHQHDAEVNDKSAMTACIAAEILQHRREETLSRLLLN